MSNNLISGRYLNTAVISKELGVCQEQFAFSARIYSDSLKEADVVQTYIEGNNYDYATLQELADAGRPAEAYNLILRISRLLNGYFKKVVTTAVAEAVTIDDTVTAVLHNEHFKLAQRLSNWESTSGAIRNDLITTGLATWSIKVDATGRKDELGRPINNISYDHVPSRQVLPDPRAVKPDKSDAKYIHYWEYMTYNEIEEEFGELMAIKLSETHSMSEEETETMYIEHGAGLYNNWDNYEYWKDGESYFVVRTYNKDKHGVISLTSWHGDIELDTSTIDAKIFPIQAIDVMRKSGNYGRYYSPLFDACTSQDAINQALLMFQKNIGQHRIIVDNTAVSQDELQDLQDKVNTIGEVLHIKKLSGIKIESLSSEAQIHLNKIYTSIQMIMQVIGINEAFLGESKAGDSGRKFEGQRSASENTLDYIFTPLNLMFESMMKQCIHYTSVYKQATEQMRFLDDFGQARWEEVNTPFLMPTGDIDEQGNMLATPIKQEQYNHSKGLWEISYVNEKSKSLEDIAVEVNVHSAPFDDTDATELAFIESLMNGQAGQIIANAHPAGIVYMYSLITKNLKTRNSEILAKYLSTLSDQLGMFNIEDPRLYLSKQGESGQGGQGAAVSAGQGAQGSQGAIQYAGGTTNDTQPAGYNQPKDN